ncbi:MAG TPA: dipeptidase [Anaerolineae bacterium]|nr:dipeptidase [Anaerolineae bacterium]
MSKEKALAYAAERRDEQLAALIDFLRIPSISTQPERAEDVRKAADWLAAHMREAGIENVEVIPTGRHPLVYGDWLKAGDGAPTVLVYGHYDVQPPDPLELWNSPPFEPVVKDDFIYARGAADDKGQVHIHVKVAEAFLGSVGEMPCNVKYIFEGEEESGGESLSQYVAENQEKLAADVVLVSDSHILSPEQPSLVYGLRGNVYYQMNITGPDHDLHSGSYGGVVDNPLNVVGHLIAKLKDENGKVLIPGFYDKVREISDEERALLAVKPYGEETLLAETGAPAAWGEPEFTLNERIGARPTLDVHGIIGGYTGRGGKTVLPSTVHIKLSMRLVPDQDPAEIQAAFKAYIEEIMPPTMTYEIIGERGAPAVVVDLSIPAVEAAKTAYGTVFGREPIFVRGGGSIPVVSDFKQHLGLETILMGFGLPDDRIHSPNERFYLGNYYKGIETVIHFLDELGEG